MAQDIKDIQPQAEPYIVKSHDIHIDADYADWIADIKSRYRSAQVKAAVKVNAEKLLFNWQLGRDLVQKKAEERWGAGVVEQVSLDLKREFPDAQGGYIQSLVYETLVFFYTDNVNPKILQQFADNVQRLNKQVVPQLYQVGKEIQEKKPYQDGKEFPVPFALVP